jgi:hypothetical protein
MRTILCIAMFAIAACSDRQENKNFPIAGELYKWPEGTTILPPGGPGVYGDGYVRFCPDKCHQSAYRLIYDGDKQSAVNEAGLPDLHFITTRFSKLEDLSFHDTAVGAVICQQKLVEVGGRFTCGFSFVHRGARWQVHFDAAEIPNVETFYRDALKRLEAIRSTKA